MVSHLLSDERSRHAVEVAERFADGLANEEERSKAEESAQTVAVAAYSSWESELTQVAVTGIRCWAATAAARAVTLAEREILEAVTDAGMALTWFENEELAAGPDYWAGIELSGPWPNLVRDIIGNPFRPVTINPAWLIWNNGTVQKIFQGIYYERAFDRLPILADALEEAGCTNNDILAHCRQQGEHVRGCWVVDLMLGKE